MKLIDLRSDTVTVPTDAMRRAIARADVGDDVFGEDPTTNCLEETVAGLLGKESALFVPSGTMGNQLALAVQAGAGDEVIVDSESHIVHYETGAPSLISRVQLRPIPLQGKVQDLLSVLNNAERPGQYYYPRTRGVCVENTHNRHSGAILPLEMLREVGQWCAQRGYFLHCDGARLWNASIATGITPAEYAAPCTTVMVCLSKGLGAPVGSVLVGSRELITEARRWRKMLGGGMRQTGILAAAGLYALEHHLPLLRDDHRRAQEFAASISSECEVFFDPPPTNIVLFRPRRTIGQEMLITVLVQHGVFVSPGPANWLRAVFHLGIDDEQTDRAATILLNVLSRLTKSATIMRNSP
ncbi:MAG: aminotransferase class I/II-fold pyridoxal phosphate-dependent enzyme [Chlorobi bacterium]|nr:aminotransferase class I/II-fold pyridoxal phosphate-dependent enzyme [Chlorobiota bacterium]